LIEDSDQAFPSTPSAIAIVNGVYLCLLWAGNTRQSAVRGGLNNPRFLGEAIMVLARMRHQHRCHFLHVCAKMFSIFSLSKKRLPVPGVAFHSTLCAETLSHQCLPHLDQQLGCRRKYGLGGRTLTPLSGSLVARTIPLGTEIYGNRGQGRRGGSHPKGTGGGARESPGRNEVTFVSASP